MKDKVVVITGGGSGLGARLAKKYSNAGAKVVLIGLTEKKLLNVAGSLPGETYTYSADVSKKSEVSRVFEDICSKLGNIDILVNCAGVGYFDLTENITDKQVDAMIDVNLKATIFCIQEVLASMKQNNSGHIVNIISMSGKRVKAAESIYCASKFGVAGFTQAVALELENTAVKITGVYMGNMATELWRNDVPAEFEQFIKPEDMAEIIFENTKFRKYLSVEEIIVKNTKY